MNAPQELAHNPEIEDLIQRSAELLKSNEALRQERDQLRRDKEAIGRKLVRAEQGMLTDRENRRAALNLMEDAVLARQAEERENAERRRVEEELREANRRKDEFLATLAHELRNPLAPICNSLNILKIAGTDSG